MQSVIKDGLAQFTIESDAKYLVLFLQGALVGAASIVILSSGGFGELTWPRLCAGIALLVIAALLRSVKRERVMAIKGMGIQITRTGYFRLISDFSLFIPYHDIADILINEVFIGVQVIPVIQIVRKDNLELIVAFEVFRPPLADLEVAWRGLRQTLYQDAVI